MASMGKQPPDYVADDCKHTSDAEGAWSGTDAAGLALLQPARLAPGTREPVSKSCMSVVPPTMPGAMLLRD